MLSFDLLSDYPIKLLIYIESNFFFLVWFSFKNLLRVSYEALNPLILVMAWVSGGLMNLPFTFFWSEDVTTFLEIVAEPTLLVVSCLAKLTD